MERRASAGEKRTQPKRFSKKKKKKKTKGALSGRCVARGPPQDENGKNIQISPYWRPNSFREIQISPYSSLNIQYPTRYLYPNT